MTTIATPTATDEEAAKATALAAHEKTHAEAIAAAETPEGAVAAMIKANDDKLAAGGITQAAHDKLTEIYTEAGVDSQKFATLMVASNGFLEQEAAKISEDAINKNVLTALLAEKGIDLESFGSFGAVFAMIFVMIDPEMSKEFMAKMKETAGVDADADAEVVVTPVVTGAEDTQPAATVEETISNIAAAADVENNSGEIPALRQRLAEMNALPLEDRPDMSNSEVAEEFMASLTDKQKIYMVTQGLESTTGMSPVDMMVESFMKEGAPEGNALLTQIFDEAGQDPEKLKQLLEENAEQIENETGQYMGFGAPVVEMNVASVNDLGGVDGTAVTYVTLDKPADVAVEGSAVIQTAMNNGDSVVSGSFNNNVTAEGSQVNATVDQDAVPIPVTPVISDPEMTDTLIVNSM